jgi:hypothetical protein
LPTLFEGAFVDTLVDLKEVGAPKPPPGGPWVIGKPSNNEKMQNSPPIYMRFATKSEKSSDGVIKDSELSYNNYKLRK